MKSIENKNVSFYHKDINQHYKGRIIIIIFFF
jgi:hypothetical protein